MKPPPRRTILTRAFHDPEWARECELRKERTIKGQLYEVQKIKKYWEWLRDSWLADDGMVCTTVFTPTLGDPFMMLYLVSEAETELGSGRYPSTALDDLKRWHIRLSVALQEYTGHAIERRNQSAKGGRARKILATKEDVRQAETIASQVKLEHPDWGSESIYNEAAKRLKKHRPDLVKRAEHFNFKLTGITIKRAIQAR